MAGLRYLGRPLSHQSTVHYEALEVDFSDISQLPGSSSNSNNFESNSETTNHRDWHNSKTAFPVSNPKMLHHSVSVDSFLKESNLSQKLIREQIPYKTVLYGLKKQLSSDIVDCPTDKNQLFQAPRKSGTSNELLQSMQLMSNRIDSFIGKWPLSYIDSEKLAKYGFFYLQSEDKVQCAYCNVVIASWKPGDEPLKEHIKFSPRCPVMSQQLVNNSLTSSLPTVAVNKGLRNSSPHINGPQSARPKFPKMSNVRIRLGTYKNWPLLNLSPTILAKCGLFYTGIQDTVTCFFCGGSLQGWEPNDDPWVEHEKFYPTCSYLHLVKKNWPSESQRMINSCGILSKALETQCARGSVIDDYIQEACNIFPQSLVETVVTDIRRRGGEVVSLHELIEEVLEFKQKGKSSSRCADEIPQTTFFKASERKSDEKPQTILMKSIDLSSQKHNGQPFLEDIRLCRICMDRDRDVLFRPCGHVVACSKCSQQLFDCPMCRQPIIEKIKCFLG